MGTYNTLLWDLDGTIIDSKIGIIYSIQYALVSIGIQVEDPHQLVCFIGPPIKKSFKDFYDLSESQINLAVSKYRERYAEKGVFENKVYQGIPELIENQKKMGKKICLATSKPEVFAKQILDYHKISHGFDYIGGSSLDDSRTSKADVIHYVLEEAKVQDISNVVMIGDRKFDIIGGKENSLDTIGVLYGYGNREELEKESPNIMVETVKELQDVLCQ